MAVEPIVTHEYLRTPEVLLPQELVYGFVREAAAPTAAHQRTVGALFIRLSQHLRETGAGEAWLSPLDVVLDVERNPVVQPDLSVVLTEHADMVTDRIWGARIEVIRFQPGIIVSTVFGPADAIRSSVLPGLRFTPLDVTST